MENEKKQKEHIIQRILAVIEQKMAEKRMKQKDLLDICAKKGYTVSQSELSRILSHKIAMGLYPALAICDALDIDINQIVHPDRVKRETTFLPQSTFVTDPSRPEIENYLGSYHTLFYATDYREDKLLRGRLELSAKRRESQAYCSAFFSLDTEDTDMYGQPIQKRYQGRFFVSPQMGIAYCFLANNKLGEICSLEFRHRTFFYKRVECRLGLVLTTSTGEKKTPAAHKIVVYRGKLQSSQEQQLAHMLKLDNGEMHIEAEALKEINVPEDTRKLLNSLSDMLRGTTYYTVNAASLKNANKKLSNVQISALFSILRDCSEDEYTLHLDAMEDEMIFDLISRDSGKSL